MALTPTVTEVSNTAVKSGSRLYDIADAAYTILDDDGFDTIVSSTTMTGARIVTLPTAADNTGRQITVKKSDAGAFTLTVDGEGAETIDGATTFDLLAQYDFITVQSDGISWHISNKSVKPIAAIYDYATAGNGNTVIDSSAEEVIDYNVAVIDTHSAVTTGASWVFTAPRAGQYVVSCSVYYQDTPIWDQGDRSVIYIRKEGAHVAWGEQVGMDTATSGSDGVQVFFTSGVNVAAGEDIDISAWQNSGSGRAISQLLGACRVSITEVS